MSLDFNYSEVADKSFIWDENDMMRGECESIIWHTMFLGINKITEDTYRDFYTRYLMLRIAQGMPEPYFTLKDVRGMIGLHTNASSITVAQFKKRIIENLTKTVDARLNKELNDLGIL